MSDGFNPAGSQFGSMPVSGGTSPPAAPPAPPPPDVAAVLGHLVEAGEQMMATLDHLAAMVPSMGGMGAVYARIKASLASARSAMTPPPDVAGPQHDHS
jgi:hypothetical protein